jgi:hypothetical protein
MVAWLITWEWCGDHAKVKNQIAAILNYRLPGKKVKEIIELIYVNTYYSFRERLAYAKNKKDNPYPATFDKINGISWTGSITCGHNPYIYARIVDDLKVTKDKNEQESLSWKERQRPKIPLIPRGNSGDALLRRVNHTE